MNEHQVRMSQAEPDEGAMHLEGYMLGFRDAEGQLAKGAQSRKMSAIESITNSFVGFWISVVLAMWTVPLLYGAPAPMKQNIISTVLFTIVSIVRSFIMRRFFTWLHHVKGIN